MLALPSRALCVGTLAAVGIIGCAPATSSSLSESRFSSAALPLTATSRVINAERIQRSGSNTALDAIRALVPGFRGIETSPVDSPWRGLASMSRGVSRILVDGHPVADVESLRLVQAADILAIHVLSAADAMIHFGPSFSNGAIVVQTQALLRRI